MDNRRSVLDIGTAWLFLALMVPALLIGSVGQSRAQAFQTDAAQAILIDAATGTVLFEKNADELMVPASMAKVMTVEVVLDELKKGRLTLESEFTISENAWRTGGSPSGGSTMFAQVGSRIGLEDLLRGMIVHSGNDACIAVAEGIAGSEENFARMMTQRARELGLTRSVFMNSTGYHHPEQLTTARELAKLTIHLIEEHPEFYAMFGEEEFTWNKIRQRNRNPLLSMNIGADGVKTGYLKESGYGLIGSAVQNEQRLIVVVNGLKTARDRANESRKLLDWGFRAFEPREIFQAGEIVGGARVFGGETSYVSLVADRPIKVLVPRGSRERLTARIVYQGPLVPPVAKGTRIGVLRVMRGDTLALEMPLQAADDIGTGTLSRRALDGLIELGTGTVRRAIFGSS